MKLITAVLSISYVLSCSSAFAEEVNPRAFDDKNTASQQGKESNKDAKAKSTQNATEQQADPNIKADKHPDKRKSTHDSGMETQKSQ